MSLWGNNSTRKLKQAGQLSGEVLLANRKFPFNASVRLQEPSGEECCQEKVDAVGVVITQEKKLDQIGFSTGLQKMMHELQVI